jgi:hypothetical protein
MDAVSAARRRAGQRARDAANLATAAVDAARAAGIDAAAAGDYETDDELPHGDFDADVAASGVVAAVRRRYH